MTSEEPPVGLGAPAASSPFAGAPVTDNRPLQTEENGWQEEERREEGEGREEAEAPGQDSMREPAPRLPVTGDRAVDEAMELLSDAAGADLDFQLEAYESAHRTLQDRLADVES